MTENLFSINDYKPSASDLREGYVISNVSEYIMTFRQSFLKWLRENNKLSENDVCTKTGIGREDLTRIEKGNVSESDLMNMQKLSKIYGVSYPYILALFKLAKRPQRYKEYKIAAYHEVEMDEFTKDQVVKFIKGLMKK